MADVNFGFDLTRNGQPVGRITDIKAPKISQGAVERTSHGSVFSGEAWREYIPDGLLQAETFTLTVELDSAVLPLFVGDMASKTIANWQLTFPNDVDPLAFSGFPLSVDPQEADATSPELLVAEVEMRPTGRVPITGGSPSS